MRRKQRFLARHLHAPAPLNTLSRVSDVILADDRSKFYFVLDYASETDGEAGQSELCTIAKAGTGSRLCMKTYENPLLSHDRPSIELTVISTSRAVG